MLNKIVIILLISFSLTLMAIMTLSAWVNLGHPIIGFFHVILTFIGIDYVKAQVKRNARG